MPHAIKVDLYRLAWPAVLAMVVHHLFRINDQFFIAPVGIEAQAAVAVGSMVSISLLAFGEMVGVGTMAISARRFGEGNVAAGHATIRRGVRLGMFVGVVLAVAVLSGLPWLCEQLIPGAENELERQYCTDYLSWIAGGMVVIAAVQVIDQSFLAMRDSRTPLVMQCLAVATNALLNWLLVPILEVKGVAIATVASRAIAMVLSLWVFKLKGVGSIFDASGIGAPVSRILRIGFPTCIAVGIYSLVYQVIVATTIKEFGPAARSALGIGFGIETIFYCLYWGLGTAVASLVGRYLGEGNLEKTLALTRLAVRVNLLLGLLICGTFLVGGEAMVRILSGDETVIAVNVEYLFFMAFAQPFQALQVSFDHALIGAGRTLPVMIGSVLMNCLRIPLASALALTWGLALPGVWWAINATTLGKCIWSFVLYRSRRWLHTRV